MVSHFRIAIRGFTAGLPAPAAPRLGPGRPPARMRAPAAPRIAMPGPDGATMSFTARTARYAQGARSQTMNG